MEEIPHLQVDAILVVVQQNLGGQSPDGHLPFLDVAHQLDVVVDAELRHQLKMDYCPDVADEVLQIRRMKMDCCPHEVLAWVRQ